MATSQSTAPFFITPSISRVISFGATAPGISTAPITTSASTIDSSICRRRRHHEADAAGEDLVEMAHPVDRALEDGHARAQAERDHGRVVADDPAADHEHPARRDSGDAAEQEAAAAERLLEEVRAGLRGEPAGDLAHRREQRQRAVVGLDGLVGDAGRAALGERARQRLARREVQVGEEHEALAQQRVLGRERLLDLEQELGLAPDVVDRSQRRADGPVGVVGEGAALPRAGLDEHVVTALDELARPGRGQRDPVLVRLDLLDDSDLHRGENPSFSAVARAVEEPARLRHEASQTRAPGLDTIALGRRPGEP